MMSIVRSIEKCVVILLLYLCVECYTTHRVSKQNDLSGYIVNGVGVSIAMYPYMAQIVVDGEFHCGGSIISNRIILTAAHCFGSYVENKWIAVDHLLVDVYLGSTKQLGGKKYEVCKTLRHERFYPWPHTTNDIGLVLLSKNITFGPKVQMATLTSNSRWKKKADKLTAIGFGATDTGGSASMKLQMTKMKYINETACINAQHDSLMSDISPLGRFCLIAEKLTGVCHGDSGSPIIWKRTVVGLSSLLRGPQCGSDMWPSVFTDVSYFFRWIRYHVEDLESGRHLCQQELDFSNRIELVINADFNTTKTNNRNKNRS